MKEPLRLRIYISEPFDFERENDSADLFGTTVDHKGSDNEWVVDLDKWFTFNENEYDTVLIAPRYVGERLDKVHNAILGVPVRIAHRTRSGWHFSMAGVLSIPFERSRQDESDDDDDDLGSDEEGKDLI
jgi:hypothetical protein